MVRDANGCEFSNTYTIGVESDLSVDVSVSRQPTDCGLSDGRVQLTVDGGNVTGVPPGSGRTLILYRNGAQERTINVPNDPLQPEQTITLGGLEPGIYYATVQSNQNDDCIVTSEEFMLQSPGSSIINEIITTPATNVLCADGQIRIDALVVGFNPQYRLLANGGPVVGATYQTSPTFTNLSQGDYVIEIRTGIQAPYCRTYASATVACNRSSTRDVAENAAEHTEISVYPNPNNGDFNIKVVASETQTYSFTRPTLPGNVLLTWKRRSKRANALLLCILITLPPAYICFRYAAAILIKPLSL